MARPAAAMMATQAGRVRDQRNRSDSTSMAWRNRQRNAREGERGVKMASYLEARGPLCVPSGDHRLVWERPRDSSFGGVTRKQQTTTTKNTRHNFVCS